MEINEVEGERHSNEEVVRVRGQKLCHNSLTGLSLKFQREINPSTHRVNPFVIDFGILGNIKFYSVIYKIIVY